MQKTTKTFTYTAQRTSYLAVVGTFGFLFLVEGSVIVLLIFIFAHNALLKFALLGAYLCLLLYIFSRLLAPLWTKHRLTATHLQLHYGFACNVSIPRTAIASAQTVYERMTMFESSMARYDAKKQRMAACFSERGQVLLHLTQPLPLKIGRKTHIANSILINVDERDDFLAALDLSPSPRGAINPTPTIADDREQRDEHRIAGNDQHGGEQRAKTLRASEHMSPAIRLEGLTRTFGTFTAVDNLNMTIRPGEIYGFLGSNGAGKTTTIKMLVGLLQPDSGHAWIVGHDMWAEPLPAKKALGYVADRALLYERLSGREFLTFLAQIRKLPSSQAQQRIPYLLDLLELADSANRLCSSYSFGMKRKLALAGALLHEPSVLILDEPLNGLDPRSAHRVKDLFIALANSGTTILLSTHDLASAEALCHRIGIIHKGRLLAEGSSSELRQLAVASDLETVFLNLTTDVQEEISI
ncbi:MAG: ABC transporter ATP-binding protein [Ktedonobacteraceae bacterium]|nr:ABC transporter ATP-binding protein [Ktedonobacteraceae bacterium]